MRTSGVVLDVYDDVGGEVLRSMFPAQNDVPDFVKSAHALTQDELGRLPDDSYALVLVNGDEKLRKFACTDAGNTALSVLYFVKHAHKLPEEARAVAAENLKVACSWYDLDVPEEIEKAAVSKDWVAKRVAGSGASVERLNAFAARMGNKAREHAVGGSERLKGLAQKAEVGALRKADKVEKGSKALSGALAGMAKAPAPKSSKKALLAGAAGLAGAGAIAAGGHEKAAGIAGWAAKKAISNPVGTAMTAMTVPSLAKGTHQKIQQNLAHVQAGEAMTGTTGGGLEALARKFASADPLEEAFKVSEVLGTSSMPISVMPKKPVSPPATISKSAHMQPLVDVTHLEAVGPRTVKVAQRYALGDQYPLDDYRQVKMASDYFSEYGRRLTPEDRHEYCSNLVKRASELGIRLPEIVQKYGSEKYASEGELRQGIDTRRQIVDHLDKTASATLEDIYAARVHMPPEDYVIVLEAFDKTAGIDHLYDRDVMDPYYSTFGFEKQAEDEDFTDTIGNFRVTGADLHMLIQNNHWLKHTFGPDFAEEYCKDPVAIYKSLPVEQKKLIIRMATENSPR